MPISYWQDDAALNGDDEDWDDDGPDNRQEQGDPDAPAAITDIPTSTTDVLRPRTVAAGYDSDRRVMTVVFREGAVFNYYDVSPGEWRTFHSSFSKGALLVKGSVFDQKDRSPAVLEDLDPLIYAEISYVARQAQLKYRRVNRSRTAQGKLAYASSKSALTEARKKNSLPSFSKISRSVQKKYGQNPATAGKAHKPHRPRGK
jgi:hypothetical protein